MKKPIIAICFFVAISAGVVYWIAARPAESAATRVDKVFAEWERPDSPGCSVAVGRNGAEVYQHGYGMANLELGVPITPASVFPLASISKQFTAMSILLLAQRGQLSLDDEARKYVPELPDYGTPLKIRHLLNHTSGLRDAFNLDGWSAPRQDNSDPNEALARILTRQRGLNFTPGAQFQYNNGGYNLLANIVKRVSGQSLRAFEDANLFKPLGMTHTLVLDDAAMIVPNRVSNYWRDIKGFHVGSEAVGIIGNAGIYSSAPDLLLWEQNLADVRVGDRALVTEMQTPAVLTNGEASPYGFGVNIGQYRGVRAIEHGGGDRGISTYLTRYPDQGLAIAVLCNSDAIPSGVLEERVADIYLSGLPAAPATKDAVAEVPRVSLSAEQLANKEGWYRNLAADRLLRVSVRDGKLTVRDVEGDDISFELTPVDANQFVVILGASAVTRVEFVPTNRTQELRISAAIEGAKPRVFEQLSPKVFSTVELRSFVGEYRSEELDVMYKVAATNSGLVIHPPGRPDIALGPLNVDEFAGSIAGIVKFSRDGRGIVTGFTMTRSLARNVRFDRMK